MGAVANGVMRLFKPLLLKSIAEGAATEVFAAVLGAPRLERVAWRSAAL